MCLLNSVQLIELNGLPEILLHRHETGTIHKVMPDSPTICLTDRIKVGETFHIFDLLLKIDDISYQEGRHLGIKERKERFKAICSIKGCNAKVVGKIDNENVIVTKVINHTCEPQGYYPNKERKHVMTSGALYGAKIISQNIHTNEYHIKQNILYRLIEKGRSNSNFEIEWKKLEAYIKCFANED